MTDEVREPIASDADIVSARHKGRELALHIGFTSSDLTLIATTISELARNILDFAEQGEILIAVVQDSNQQGIRIIAQDNGPGIPDIELALQDGYSSGHGLGLGLPGVRRMMDDFEIASEVGKGTRVTVQKWRR